MKLNSHSIKDGEWISPKFALGVFDKETHVTFSDNVSPHLAWSQVPEGVQSFAVFCVDIDVPSSGEDVNQEEKTVPAELPRVPFYHWSLVNIPSDQTEIQEGAHSQGVTARGKSGPGCANGWVHGLNNYTDWFKGDEAMEGDYFGYDGPCPPWNDSIVHRYVFTVLALDIKDLGLTKPVSGEQLFVACEPHVIEKASLTGKYTINPDATLPD